MTDEELEVQVIRALLLAELPQLLAELLRRAGAAALPAGGNTGTGYTPVPATPAARGGVVLAQDLGGTATAPRVTGLQGTAVSPVAPLDGQALRYDAATATWRPSAVGSGEPLANGDPANPQLIFSDTGDIITI